MPYKKTGVFPAVFFTIYLLFKRLFIVDLDKNTSTSIKFDSRKSSVSTPIIIALAISLITIATLIVIATQTLDIKDTKLRRQMINSSLLFMMQELEKTTMDLAWYDEAIQKIFIDKDLTGWKIIMVNICTIRITLMSVSLLIKMGKHS